MLGCILIKNVLLRLAAWWQHALRWQHIRSQRFLIKNPGLVLIRRTPAAGLSSTADSNHDCVQVSLPSPPSFSALRATELLLDAPVKLNRRPWQCAVGRNFTGGVCSLSGAPLHKWFEEKSLPCFRKTVTSRLWTAIGKLKFQAEEEEEEDGNSISRTQEVSMKKYEVPLAFLTGAARNGLYLDLTWIHLTELHQIIKRTQLRLFHSKEHTLLTRKARGI